MTACMVTYSFYENDARVMRYAEALARRGDRVEVFALRREGQSAEEVIEGVRVFRIQRRRRDRSGIISYASGILLFFLRAMASVAHRHLTVHYQLIHVHSVPDFLVFAVWVPKLLGARVILDIHDLLPEFYVCKYGTKKNSILFRLLVFAERASGQFADHVIAANDLWQQRLVSRSVCEHKCSSMVNVPSRAIYTRRGRTRTDHKIIILYPGTLNRHQGLDIAIRAFARVKSEIPEAEFHIYGEGPCRASLAELIDSLALQDCIFLKNFCSSRSIAQVIENADLGVVPKRKDGFGNEAFSTKIMEFMALGVPVIVSDTAVDRYYFNDSVVRFFRSGDEQDLARSIVELIRQPEARESLARNALQLVEHNNWDTLKPKYLALVDGLTGNRTADCCDSVQSDAA